MSLRIVHITSALLVVLLGGCAPADSGNERPAEAAASSATTPEAGSCRILRATLPLPSGLGEASGAAWSATRPAAFWSHNDSGGDPELFLVSTADGEAERVSVNGAAMDDWEDLALGSCADGRCLYIADVGDNGRKKNDPLALHVLPEPAPGARAGTAESYTAVFPDGRGRDVEAMFLLPDGRIHLITKGNRDPIELYQWPTPLRPGGPATLRRVRELAPEPEQTGDRVTGASASPDGRYVAVRTYALLAIYRTDALLGGGEPDARMDLAVLAEGQGEGVALADDGTVVLVSESGSKHVPGTAALLRCPLP